MTDLIVNQKYPNSWRIDHPDFGDVSKTAYAKGVISDFNVDDPDDMVATIHSQVKVTGDFGESDWIPLFYHPKAQYWDDDQAKAIDFDQEKVNFERAWMSFRGDDEVVVMLKEGVPVAVLGFADGVPRIGEDIVRCDYENGRGGKHFFYFRSSTNDRFLGLTDPSSDNEYDVELNDPEDKPLNLKTEVKPIIAFNRKIVTPLHNTTEAMNDVGGIMVYSQYAGETANYFIHEFRIPVGPILHIIQVLSEYVDRKTVDNTGFMDIGGLPPGYSLSNPLGFGMYSTLTTVGHAINTLGMYIQTALFTKDRYGMPHQHIADVMGAINNNTPWWYKYEDEGFQDNFGLMYKLFYVDTDRGSERDPRMVMSGTKWLTGPYYNSDGSLMDTYQGPHHSTPWNTAGGYAPADEYDSWFWEKYGPDWTTAKFMVRPHTKAELQAAGMWPAGA